MDASYLRVKNWSRFQHYDAKRRRPPWIKFYNDLLGDDDDFGRLTEVEQWQLVRIWLIASRSSRFTAELVNEELRVVPVVAFDEQTLRRAIQSLKKIPLARFVREGWLIPVGENELVDPETGDLLAQVLADVASEDASADASALLELENQRSRELEESTTAFEVREALERQLGAA